MCWSRIYTVAKLRKRNSSVSSAGHYCLLRDDRSRNCGNDHEQSPQCNLQVRLCNTTIYVVGMWLYVRNGSSKDDSLYSLSLLFLFPSIFIPAPLPLPYSFPSFIFADLFYPFQIGNPLSFPNRRHFCHILSSGNGTI